MNTTLFLKIGIIGIILFIIAFLLLLLSLKLANKRKTKAANFLLNICYCFLIALIGLLFYGFFICFN